MKVTVKKKDNSQPLAIHTEYIKLIESIEALPRVKKVFIRSGIRFDYLMADKDTEYVLMDYTHLVGELEVHYLGYMLTGALGAENGPLSSFYRSCRVADLNIDESRFGPIIDVIGIIYG